MSIRKHTAYNLAGGVLPLALSLFTIPLYIHAIGDARYGVLAIAWLLLGYFGLFDLGLSTATAQRIAALMPDADEERSRIFWTALAMNAGLGLAGGLLILPAAFLFFANSASVEPAMRREVSMAIPWLALAVPLATVSGVLTGALQGRAKFLELNAISILGAVLAQLIPLAVAHLHGPSLGWLVPAVVFARLVVLAALAWRCEAHVTRGHARSFSPAEARSLLRFGGWVTVTSAVGPLMVILDRFVIGALLGPRSVAHYTVPFQLAERTGLLPGALAMSLFPRMASSDAARARDLAAGAIRVLAVIMTPLTTAAVLLFRPFLGWWLTPEFAAQASLPGQLLLLGFWINAFALVPYALLQAAGRPDTVAKCHVLELVPYLGGLYLGLHFFGVPGAALVFGLRTLADCILLMHFGGTLTAAARALAVPVVLLMVAFGFACTQVPELSFRWGIGAAAIAVAVVAWACRAAPPELRAAVARIGASMARGLARRAH